MQLLHSPRWFGLTEQIVSLDSRLYSEQMKATEQKILTDELQELSKERHQQRKSFTEERKHLLIQDMIDLVDEELNLEFSYVDAEYITMICPKEGLDITEKIPRRISAQEWKSLNVAGNDVCIVRTGYYQKGKIRISDSGNEFASAMLEGHEAGHALMEGTKLQIYAEFIPTYWWPTAYPEAKMICETAADLIGNDLLKLYIEQHYEDDLEAQESMQTVLDFQSNLRSLIREAEETIAPLLASGAIEEADARLEEYTSMTEEILGGHMTINRATITCHLPYGGNSDVESILTTLKKNHGIQGMLDAIGEVITIEDLKAVVQSSD